MNSPTAVAQDPKRSWWAGPWPLVVFFFAWCLFFNTRSVRPYYYEKDAPSKVAQVVSGQRNFFHPLLMVNTADALMRLCRMEWTEENASRAGHWAIAFFSAASVAVFILLGYRCGGWLAALAVGVWLGLDEFILQLAHYFKEDPALLIGLGLSFLAMKLFDERPTIARAGWLGAACGVAISGKYVGVAALLLALPLVIAPGGGRLTRAAVLVASCLFVLIVVNWQWLVNFHAAKAGVETEMHDLLGRENFVKKVPHVRDVISYFRGNMPWFIVLGVLLQIGDLVRARQGRVVEWMLLFYSLVYSAILMWSPRLFERHFLPVFVSLWFLSALGWVNAVRWGFQRFRGSPTACTVVVLAGIAYTAWRLEPAFFNRQRHYSVDDRVAFASWIRENLPADAVIAQDRRVFLKRPDGSARPELALPHRIVTANQLSEFRTLDGLRKSGITHLAMHRLDSGRFMPGGKLESAAKPTTSMGRNRPERRAFYDEVLSHSHRVFGNKYRVRIDEDDEFDSGLMLYAIDYSN